MLRVLVSDPLSEQGLAILRQGSYPDIGATGPDKPALRPAPQLEVDYRPGLKEAELAAAIPGAHALVIRSGSKVTARVIEAATDLRVIGRAGIGVDNVDVDAASKRGVVVMNTPTGNAVTTAEHAIGLLFSLARMIPQASASMRAGKWEKKKFEGRELAGKTLGVIGLGNIGRIVANRAKGLGMHVIGFDPMLSSDRAAALGAELVSLEEIWRRADAISVHTPLTAETKGLVNDEVVAKLKKGALLINAARGGIYDLDALLRGLESGQLGGVALDVFEVEPPPADAPILKHERCIATPHLGASTIEAQDRVALEIAEQVVAFLATGATKNAVNMPSVTSEVAAKLSPWAALAERLGSFVAQVERGLSAPSAFEVECVGDPGEISVKLIAASALAGFLRRYLDAPVNQVSAPHAAADRGIALRELRTMTGRGKYASQVILRVFVEGQIAHTVEGTLGADSSARLVKWGDFEVEAHLGGPTLVVTSIDKPGVIGFLGTALGDANVNVARVHLGMAGPGGAISVWNLSQPIPAQVLEGIRSSPNVRTAIAVEV
jgi:D-3-phosphoglycerate dehydrogenase